jgi:hypothetical protein
LQIDAFLEQLQADLDNRRGVAATVLAAARDRDAQLGPAGGAGGLEEDDIPTAGVLTRECLDG